MIPDDGIHIGDAGGHPQPEPGRWPTHLNDHPSIVTWLAWKGRTYCETWARPTNDLGQCKGCLATHRTLFGLVIPHEPSPPKVTHCWVCKEPHDPPSYIDAPHPWCDPGGGPDDAWAEGYAPSMEGWE